ncbi:MAG: glycosyltransferase family 4 protein [Cyclobacteriaceae bacterium]
MRVLEIVNSLPGETFVRAHARAVINHTDTDLVWGAWQTARQGKLISPVNGLDVFGLSNYNRMGKASKASIRVRHRISGNPTFSPDTLVTKDVQALRPDLIHFQFASLAGQHYHWAVEAGIPYTFSVRGSDVHTQPLGNEPYRQKVEEAGKHAKGIHFVSQSMVTAYHRNIGQSGFYKVIRTPIDPSWAAIERRPIPDRLVSVGRLTWQKDFPSLLRTMQRVSEVKPDAELVIAGDGPDREQLEYMIRDLGLENKVKLLGKIGHDDVKQLYSEAAVVIQTSIAEGFPNSLAEAMYAGVPIVTTRAGGIEEVLTDSETGLLTATDDVEELSAKVLYALGNEQCIKEMALKIKPVAEKSFSAENHGRAFADFWKEAMS